MADFVSLYTSLSGLWAAQAGIDTASHNVANVSTPGYTRRRVALATRDPYQTAHGWGGSGVDIVGFERARDVHLDARARAGAAAFGGMDARAGLLRRVEDALAEPDQGISAALTELWVAFDEWALDPPGPGPRAGVLQALGGLATRVRAVATDWAATAAAAGEALVADVAEVNVLAVEVAELNRAIAAAGGPAGPPADLADRRDLALDRLAELVGGQVTMSPDGMARVSVSGMAIVDGVTAAELQAGPGGQVIHQSGVVVEAGGAIGAAARVITDDLPGLRADLDIFAAAVADAVNAVHAGGWSSAATPGGALLAYDPADAAASLAVVITDPADLAAATTPGPPFPVFDGGNAAALAELRTMQVGGGSLTLSGTWEAVVGRLGATTAAADAAARTQGDLLTAAELARQAAHGVSLDEEMATLMQFQRAYEAAARVLTAVDETLELLVNRTGLVGR